LLNEKRKRGERKGRSETLTRRRKSEGGIGISWARRSRRAQNCSRLTVKGLGGTWRDASASGDRGPVKQEGAKWRERDLETEGYTFPISAEICVKQKAQSPNASLTVQETAKDDLNDLQAVRDN